MISKQSKKRTHFTHVYLPNQQRSVQAGVLRLTEFGRDLETSEFVYGIRFARFPTAFSLDPLDLPLHVAPETTLFPGRQLHYFGAFRDATPDFWGRRLIEAKLNRHEDLPESEYLLHAGPNRVGALDFRSKRDSGDPESHAGRLIDLEYLLETSERVENHKTIPKRLQPFLEPGSSLGGKRPKAAIEADDIEWLAKFPSTTDRYNVPHIEYATLELARACGLNVPHRRLEKISNNKTVMLIQRFDRHKKTHRHFISALTITGKHESEALGTAYSEIAEAISLYGAKETVRSDCSELFARMVFNILVSNDDDHLRNHGFLWNQTGYSLSPLYDVVPHPQVAAERRLCLGIGAEGRNATLANAMSNYGAFLLRKDNALEIIERLSSVVREWKTYFEEFGVSGTDIDRVASAFRSPKNLL
jgi:serine/threonine-protein kinase HipA